MNSLGDHLRKRRLDLHLFQRQVAEKIGVDASTVWNWERQRSTAALRFIARIIEFLGYDPLPQPETFGDKLKSYRLKLGLSQEGLAARLGVDPGTIGHWERGEHRPMRAFRKMLERLFKVE